MNIDFLIYTPPKVNYDLITLWGEVIYIPKRNKSLGQKQNLADFLNCYTARKENDVDLSLEAARLETLGIPIQTIIEKQTQRSNTDYQLTGQLIPCLYLDSTIKSKYLIIYFHSSGEDIKFSKGLLNHLRTTFQINVLSMEYPGYSIYKGSPNSQTIKQNAEVVYDYMTRIVGFLPQNIVIIGRSIGSTTAIDLANKRMIAALALISPPSSLKGVVKQLVGGWASFLIKQEHNNIQKIQNIRYPLFLLHGKADSFISYQNSVHIAKKYKGEIKVKFPKDMTHSAFDYSQDLSNPLKQFLQSQGFNFSNQQSNGPQIPSHLFRNPQQMFNLQKK